MPAKLVGADRLRQGLTQVSASLADLGDAHTAVGKLMADAARPLTPRRTGRLAASIQSRGFPDRAQITAGAGLPYAGIVHWGWPAHHIRATRFLAGTIARTETQRLNLYTKHVQSIVDGSF